MTSTPRKLDTAQDDATKPEQRIDDFSRLLVALKTDQAFAHYKTETPDAGVIGLDYKQVTLVFIDSAVWHDEQRLQPFLQNVNATNLTLIFCGQEKELAHRPKSTEHSNIHLLALPTTFVHLDHFVQNLYRAKLFHQQVNEEVRKANETSKNVKLVLSISRELNGVRDVQKLLGLILEKAREVTMADAGSIYVVEHPTEEKEGSIIFKVCQNDSVVQNLTEFRMPISDQSIVGNVVIHQTMINIPDLHKLDPDASKNPYNARHDTSWEKRIGYECHSMLTLPMYDFGQTVIGVIQLINCKLAADPLRRKEDFQNRVIAFTDTAIEYGEIVAHQAGIALENALLTEERQNLFEGFVAASVNAIEQRDPTTSGHSHRVARLTLSLAEVINRTESGVYGEEFFNEKRLKEIEYASLLHDFGKIAVREEVLLKAKKLFPWEKDLLLERFELIRSRYEIEYLQNMINWIQSPNNFPPGVSSEYLLQQKQIKLAKINEYLDFILKANEPTVLEQGGFERLKDIANLKFTDSKKQPRPFLHKRELSALSVSRGSLTSDEFAEIQSHVAHTYDFLRKIPWGRELANVPQIAAKHHEKLDGSGYPTSAAAEDIPIQSRMMTIADIFDALTAADRPYKRSVPVEKALAIIEMEVKSNKCDPELFRLFVESKCYEIS